MRDVILISFDLSDAAGDADDELPTSSARQHLGTDQGPYVDSIRTVGFLRIVDRQSRYYAGLVQGIRQTSASSRVLNSTK